MEAGAAIADDAQQGLAEIADVTLAYTKSLALKAAVLLGIPDAIATKSMDAFLTLDEIATAISAKNKDYLHRIMRYLVLNKMFARKKVQVEGSDKLEVAYGLTPASKWPVSQGATSISLAPFCIFHLEELTMASWHSFHDCILEEESNAFTKTHGKDFWEFAATNEQFNEQFNKAMVSTGFVLLQITLQRYQGFQGINTLVDVGGGLGFTCSKLVAAHPTIKCINFDLPHVVANAPVIPGVQHVGGNMFKHIPEADAILMKTVLHNWDDAKCLEVLKICHRALSEKGKVIILDLVLQAEGFLDKTKMALDLLMMAQFPGGRERTQDEWITLLSSAGFFKVTIDKSPESLLSIIEAFKDEL